MTLMPPLGILYRISDLLAPIVYHVVRYRRRLVRKNLTESFPDKPLSEIKRIERRFYRNFTDNFIEAIKLLGITDREMRRRVVFGGIEKVDEIPQPREDHNSIFCPYSQLGVGTLNHPMDFQAA